MRRSGWGYLIARIFEDGCVLAELNVLQSLSRRSGVYELTDHFDAKGHVERKLALHHLAITTMKSTAILSRGTLRLHSAQDLGGEDLQTP